MDRKSRPLHLLIGVAVASAVALVVVEWPRVRNWYRPPAAGLPAPGEIAEMRATVWAAGSRGHFESDVPEFVVPHEAAPRLWKRLEPAVPVADPPEAQQEPLGQLTVTTRDGRVTRVRFYETGTDELLFTPDGEHFFRSVPRNDLGFPLGGGFFLAGSLRQASVSADLPNHPSPAPSPPTRRPPQRLPTPALIAPGRG
jgi:hypothetical protein